MFLWKSDFNRAIRGLHYHLNRLEINLVATQQELDAKIDELTGAVSTELQQLADAIAKAAPDLAPQVAKIQGLIDALKADDPAV